MQSVSSTFHQLAQGGVRPHKWELLMSFEKQFDDSIEYFTLDSSLLDGDDILKPVDDNPIQYWDYYNYESYRDRLQSMSWSSSLDFPYSVQLSSADISLNNYDNYFTPNTFSPLAPYILPGRPVKILAGYGGQPTIQQFVGLTQNKPTLDRNTKTAQFHALGFLSEIYALRLSNTLALSNVRTDEALIAILDQFGISNTSYSFDRGRNTIPFLFLESGTSVGDAIDKIMQAEGGKLFIDEQGVIRFIQRLNTQSGPVFTFNESNVVSSEHVDDPQVINRVVIKSNIRALQDNQPIFFGSGNFGNATLTEKLLVSTGQTAQYEISLVDPIASYTDPANGVSINDSWFTAQDLFSVQVNSNVTVIDSTFTAEKLILTFQNTNIFDIYIDAIEVWGTPAKIIDSIVYDAHDQESIDEHGQITYKLDNDLFGNVENAESFAYTILDAYAQPSLVIDMVIKGDYALQLGDVVWLDLPDTSGSFQIISMSTIVSGNGIEEKIRVRSYQYRPWFILDSSDLDGDDELAP